MSDPQTTVLTVPAATIELQPGERYAGAVLDAEGHVLHHTILLPARPEGPAPWQAQMDWAASIGGDLPSPREQSLLFANCRESLPGTWCWSNETCASSASYAWHCYFDNGIQDYDHKSFPGSAVAVRRLNP